jgi:hypothetical protein
VLQQRLVLSSHIDVYAGSWKRENFGENMTVLNSMETSKQTLCDCCTCSKCIRLCCTLALGCLALKDVYSWELEKDNLAFVRMRLYTTAWKQVDSL